MLCTTVPFHFTLFSGMNSILNWKPLPLKALKSLISHTQWSLFTHGSTTASVLPVGAAFHYALVSFVSLCPQHSTLQSPFCFSDHCWSISFRSLPYISLVKARALVCNRKLVSWMESDNNIESPGRLEESAEKWAGIEESNTVRQQAKSNPYTCSEGAPITAAELWVPQLTVTMQLVKIQDTFAAVLTWLPRLTLQPKFFYPCHFVSSPSYKFSVAEFECSNLDQVPWLSVQRGWESEFLDLLISRVSGSLCLIPRLM